MARRRRAPSRRYRCRGRSRTSRSRPPRPSPTTSRRDALRRGAVHRRAEMRVLAVHREGEFVGDRLADEAGPGIEQRRTAGAVRLLMPGQGENDAASRRSSDSRRRRTDPSPRRSRPASGPSAAFGTASRRIGHEGAGGIGVEEHGRRLDRAEVARAWHFRRCGGASGEARACAALHSARGRAFAGGPQEPP